MYLYDGHKYYNKLVFIKQVNSIKIEYVKIVNAICISF